MRNTVDLLQHERRARLGFDSIPTATCQRILCIIYFHNFSPAFYLSQWSGFTLKSWVRSIIVAPIWRIHPTPCQWNWNVRCNHNAFLFEIPFVFEYVPIWWAQRQKALKKVILSTLFNHRDKQKNQNEQVDSTPMHTVYYCRFCCDVGFCHCSIVWNTGECHKNEENSELWIHLPHATFNMYLSSRIEGGFILFPIQSTLVHGCIY